MSSPWRLVSAALRYTTHWTDIDRQPGASRTVHPSHSGLDLDEALPPRAPALLPLIAILIGLLGAILYWLCAQAWPASVAVAICLLAITATFDACGSALSGFYWVFVVLIKYATLMALTAARVPLEVPEHATLGLILLAGLGASHAMLVSVMSSTATAARRIANVDLAIALIIGFSPAVLLGMPGLIGLVVAIMARLTLTPQVLTVCRLAHRRRLDVAQHITEICFYLGALAAWRFI